MIFRHPWVLLLLLLYIPLIWWYIAKNKDAEPSLGVSSLRAFDKMPVSWRVWVMRLCFGLKLAAVGLLIVALARPQGENSKVSQQLNGTDIVLALDVSESMLARDMNPTRFDAARRVAIDFVKKRTDDNIGLVVFAGQSLSLMPLTNDRLSAINAIENIRPGELGNGTAIGDGLASAINRLVSGKAKSKSVILLTDGANNAGEVAPNTAADIAAQKGIRVYTIGVGTDGVMHITDPYGFSSTTMTTAIDEEGLKKMADVTKAKYFRAENDKVLEEVFNEIDRLEKTRMEVNRYSRMDENFMPWMLAALACYALMLGLRYTVLKRIP